jgi:hypothetical protein
MDSHPLQSYWVEGRILLYQLDRRRSLLVDDMLIVVEEDRSHARCLVLR